jgi:S-formylglutathione hydrolase
MTFAIYLPPEADKTPVPVLWYLSGLNCTHANAMEKSGLQQFAAEQGIAIVFPDTSPRGEGVADDEAYDLGQGAGFYVNAPQAPWSAHFKMYDYVVEELPALILAHFPVTDRFGITGHSKGGHGALTIAMRNPDKYISVSAFAPIANPSQSDWGRKQLGAYLGDDIASWVDHDATCLLETRGWSGDILIDQGASDPFLDLLKPEALATAIATKRQAATNRMQAHYDHSYFFVSTFAADHVRWHAARLR